MSSYTSPKQFEDAYSTLFETFSTGITKSLAWRKWQLKQCWWMIIENETALLSALNEDLNRHDFESHMTDLLGLKTDILEHVQHLEEWAADVVPTGAGFLFGTLGKARIRKEPLGVALIIGSWNFPILLLLQPMLAAIAAGCCVMLKPSELTTASQNLLVNIVPKYMDSSAIRIVTGGPAETGRILEHRFNHIFFTGSSKVARLITAAAAKHLTPTVLELGGQGPAIVTSSANVDLAAKRIAYGKFMNAGQICLSINHVFVDPAVHSEFVERIVFWFDKYMSSAKDQYCKIVNERNYDRIVSMLEESGGKIECGGKGVRSERFIPPTAVTSVDVNDSLLTDELFSPILPVIKANYVEAYKTISAMDHPLAIYIFSTQQSVIDEIIDHTISGGVTINDVMIHSVVPGMPFGGVGESGYGSYHGKYGVATFSHQRAIVAPPTWLDPMMSFRYPPYDIKNLGKVAVSNKLGFKKGEGIVDQKIRSVKTTTMFGRVLQVAVSALVLGVVVKLLTGQGFSLGSTFDGF